VQTPPIDRGRHFGEVRCDDQRDRAANSGRCETSSFSVRLACFGESPRTSIELFKKFVTFRIAIRPNNSMSTIIKCRGVVRTLLILGVSIWIARPSWGQDTGAGSGRDEAPMCHERNAAIRPAFEKLVSEHNSCLRSSDCAVVTPGCPLGCYAAERRSDVPNVESRARELVAQSGPDCRCMYKCPPEPSPSCTNEMARRSRRIDASTG
jgi:hypothetical protein